MESFTAYIKSIAVFALLIVFADIFMPGEFYKKYTGFILGILLSVMAVSPVINIVKGDLNADSFIEKIEESSFYDESDLNFENENIILKSIFEQNSLASIKSDLKNAGINFDNVNVEITQDDSGQYIFKKIDVVTNDPNAQKAKSIIEQKYMAEETVISEP